MMQATWLLPYRPFRHSNEQNIRRALGRWKSSYDAHIAAVSVAAREVYGFVRHVAIEFWALAELMNRQGVTTLGGLASQVNQETGTSSVPVNATAEQAVFHILRNVRHSTD